MNLPYCANSTETGTAGDSVSVVLRERLNSSTVYYYTVSAVSGDMTVTVRGNFTTLQYNSKDSKKIFFMGLSLNTHSRNYQHGQHELIVWLGWYVKFANI